MCDCADDTPTPTVATFQLFIRPVNDPPVMKIPANFVLHPFYRVTGDFPLFPVTDADDVDGDVLYRLLTTGHQFYLYDASVGKVGK